MIKIATIVGARPQLIKASVVSRQLRTREGIEEVIIHTGQHFDANMSEIFFTEMEIPLPDINMGIHGKSEGVMMGEMILALDGVFEEVKPDCVLVYGDTTSTLAGAIAANKKKLSLAHVEAGLRSRNRSMPEEINRIFTDQLSDLLFCPTKNAVHNLMTEDIDPKKQKIILSGDVMYDAFQYYSKKIQESELMSSEIIESGDFVLLTLHRQSNVEDLVRLSKLIEAVEGLSNKVRIIFPCHPRTRKNIVSLKSITDIELIEPVGYLDMLNLLKNCKMVLTDSGGLQKEAYFAKKYCLTLRKETEWVELVEGGWNQIAGNRLNELEEIYDELASKSWEEKDSLYGDGNASKLIVDELVNYS